MTRIMRANHGRYSIGSNQQVIPDPRLLFANNEPGVVFDADGLYGASEAKRTWRRNLLGYTEQLTNAYWSAVNSTVSETGTGPLNISKAFTLEATSTTGLLRRAWTLSSANETRTFSFYAKAGTANWVAFRFNSFDTTPTCYFDLQNGAVGTVSVSLPANSASITSVGGGWYRCTITNLSSSSDLSGNLDIHVTDADNSLSVTSGKTILFTGLQFEIGAATEYQRITDFSSDFIAAFPTHALYQDVNGVTPVTAPGDPIGLQLDVSRGGLDNLGAELVTNGGFDAGSTTGWSLNSEWSNVGNTISITNPTSTGLYLTQTTSMVQNRWYLVTFDVLSLGTGNIEARLGASASGNGVTSVSTTGSKRLIMQCTGTGGVLYFRGTTTSGTYTLDNISVREIPGTHRYQSVSGSRPVLARIPEGGRKNLLTYSEQLDNVAWTKDNSAAITANTSSSPDGTNTADTLTAGTTGTFRQIRQLFALTSGNQRTFTCYLKAGTSSIAYLLASDMLANADGRYFDLSNGTLGGQTGMTVGSTITLNDSSIENVGSGWYRCRITVTVSATTTFSFLIGVSDANNSTTATAGKTILAWGAQLETGSSATAYQKVTLNSDVTESGKRDCYGVLYDGSDDSFITASLDFNTYTQTTRRNLLVDTESFGSSTWTKTNTTATENTTTAPDGTTTADSIQESASGTFNRRVSYSSTTLSAINYTFSFYAKKNGINFVRFYESTTGSGRVTWFDINTGAVGTKDAAHTASITSVGSGWYRCSVVFLAGTTADTPYIGLSDVNGSITYTGTGSDGIYLWGAQLEAGTLTDYQRVGTDKMTLMSAVRKLSDAAAGCIAELSANMSTNNGSIRLLAPQSAGVDDYSFASKGTAQATATGTGMAAPATAVLVGIGDISGDSSIIRKNGVQANSSAVDQGSGNYGNYPLYFGRRGNAASLIYNGYEFATIIRGATTLDGIIANFERNYLARRAGIVLP